MGTLVVDEEGLAELAGALNVRDIGGRANRAAVSQRVSSDS